MCKLKGVAFRFIVSCIVIRDGMAFDHEARTSENEVTEVALQPTADII
jgi:hypothetical protein